MLSHEQTAPVTIAKPRRLLGLDSLRGLAIALVILFHVQLHFPAPGLLGRIALLGYNGVQLFFVVSGITMCYMWSARREETWETGKFLIRRLCRIAPPFWFAIVFYMLWRQTGWSNLEPAGALDALITALLLHGVVPRDINLVVPGGWSIAAEAGFYVLFPWLVTRFTTAAARLWAALALWAVCTVCAWQLRRQFNIDETVLYYTLLTQLPIFMLAMALYDVLFRSGKIPVVHAAAIAAIWIAAAVIGKQLGWPTRPALWAEVVLMLAFAAAVLKRYESRPLAFLGRISFSAYLFHFAVIDVLALWLPHTPGLFNFIAGLALASGVTIVVAWISSRTLEAWSTNLGRFLVARLDRAPRPRAAG
jgi:exopolysaccharide production protein ExoZ